MTRLSPPDYPDITRHNTFPKLLAYNAHHWPDAVALREKEFGVWNEFTWRDYQQAVERFKMES